MKSKITDVLKYIFSGGTPQYKTVTVRKRTLYTIGIIAAALVLALLLIFNFSGTNAEADEPKSAPTQIAFSKSDMDVSGIDLMGTVIVIDAAHGIGLNYNKAENGVTEEELTLDIAKAVKKNLESRNATVILTRSTSAALGEDAAADNEIRAQIIEEANADLAVSIHANWYDEDDVSGAQTFFLEQGTDGKKAATAILDMINYNLEYDVPRMPIEGNYSVLDIKSLPVCVVELGFLSNPDEAELLSDEEYRQQLADAISDGILLYEKRLRQQAA